MDKLPTINTPIFIPKPTGQESAFVDLSLDYPVFLMDAHITAFNPNPAEKIAKACKLFIINPVTNFFIEKAYQDKGSFKKLPYSPKQPFKVEDLLVNESLRTQKLVNPAIDYQLNKNTGVIVLPYLFTENETSTKFGINLSMISDGIKYVRSKKIRNPLFAMINIGSTILSHPEIINYIVERYDDDFKDNIQGYLIMLNQLNTKDASTDILDGLANLVFQLAKNKHVFVLKIGAFGEILSSIGASGFSSGLAVGESFQEEGLRKKLGGFGRLASTYVPELFDYINDEEINKTNYKCSCPSCNGSLPKNIFSKKAHFLYRRMETMKLLSSLNRAKRISLMEHRLKEAIKLATTYNKKYTLSLRVNHLENWLHLLELSKHWSHENNQKQKSVDLDKLIHKIRAKSK